jgi:ubiquinone/menaquinone biosynthesis C-methylase UbiE
MDNSRPFEKYYKEYDNWFIKNKNIFLSELNALKIVTPKNKKGIGIGVGTGRFAIPLNIEIGIEPSRKMANIARSRGLQVFQAVAEKLPFDDEIFDFVLMVTTICFLEDIIKSFQEAYRILRKNGCIIIAFIDKNSEIGNKYQTKRKKSKFYRYATFYSECEVIDFLKMTYFDNFIVKQTVFPCENHEFHHIKNGFDKGSFVIIKAIKTNQNGNYKNNYV